MTTPQIKYLTKLAEEITDNFFKQDNQGLDWIYDTVIELPALLVEYDNQLADKEYNSLKEQLQTYKKALAEVRKLNTIRYVFN